MKFQLLVSISICLSVLSFSQKVHDKNFLIVAKDGTGNFTTIQEALNSIPQYHKDFFTVIIKDGIYNEKIFVEQSNLIICGESKENTIIEFAELRKNWRQNNNDDDYGSAVVNIKKDVTDIVILSLIHISEPTRPY